MLHIESSNFVGCDGMYVGCLPMLLRSRLPANSSMEKSSDEEPLCSCMTEVCCLFTKAGLFSQCQSRRRQVIAFLDVLGILVLPWLWLKTRNALLLQGLKLNKVK